MRNEKLPWTNTVTEESQVLKLPPNPFPCDHTMWRNAELRASKNAQLLSFAEQDLAKANRRIAELEAEVKKLKGE